MPVIDIQFVIKMSISSEDDTPAHGQTPMDYPKKLTINPMFLHGKQQIQIKTVCLVMLFRLRHDKRCWHKPQYSILESGSCTVASGMNLYAQHINQQYPISRCILFIPKSVSASFSLIVVI